MRIVTRPDFDGVICAVLLFDVEKISRPTLWIEPYEIKNNDGLIKEGDIIANLPYIDKCSLWFDHHYSNKPEKPFNGAFEIAPSAARIIYEYYKGRFSKDFNEIVIKADKIDSADFTIDEILNPENDPYIMLYFTISGRIKTDEDYWNKIVYLLGKYDINEIIKDQEVKKKCNIIIEQDRIYEKVLRQYTDKREHITITDFRAISAEPKGSRFLVYTLFPDSYVNVKIRYDKSNREKVIVSLGQNIFNRKGKVHLGHLVSNYGGGGHEGAGSCHFHISEAQKKIDEIINVLLTDESIH
ncbi:MAG: exopolyphosphatase [Spirochaetes bacterium]|nr:exopolyphosphatase [Spirochaetota bacterium]